MKIAIAHLSDIHFQKTPDKNPILEKREAIASAIRSATMDARFVIFIVSGDIAFSGAQQEYNIAIDFLHEVFTTVHKSRGNDSCYCVVIPGNHDCDFSSEDSTRDMLLEQIPKTVLKDKKSLNDCLTVQENYRAFCDQLKKNLNGQIDVIALKSWILAHSFTLDEEHRISLLLLNTSWCSTLKEKQGTFHQPCYLLSKEIKPQTSPHDTVITVMHHPLNWYESQNSRELRRLLESNSDIILTGHEHETGVFSKSANIGTDNTYIEGGVLQETSSPDKSSFVVTELDTGTSTQKSTTYHYNKTDHKYINSENNQDTLPFIRNRSRLNGSFPFTEKFEEWLHDPGVQFNHPAKQRLTLEDVFVCPDLREVSSNERPDSGIIPGHRLKDVLTKEERILLIGSETSGKSTLAKHLTTLLKSSDQTPLFIHGTDLDQLSTLKTKNCLNNHISDTYGKHQIEPFWQLERDQRAVIIDDYQHFTNTATNKSYALEWLSTHFKFIVVIATDDVRLEELQRSPGSSTSLYDFKHLEIMELGHALRSIMVKKWYSASGYFGTIPTTKAPLHEIEAQITATLGEQLMPAYPLCILVILQQLEIANKPDLGGSSLGFIYDALIVASLNEAKTSQSDIDTNRNYLSEFAYYLFCEKQQTCPHTDYRLWHDRHCKRYQLSIDSDRHLKALVKASLLANHDGQIQFRYPYIFYYFCGFHFSTHIKEEFTLSHIRTLSSYLHQTDAANIILFTCHFTRDPSVIECICQTANDLFASHQEANLDDDVKEIAFPTADSLPLDLGKNNPEDNRQDALRKIDELDSSRSAQTAEAQQMLYDKRCEVQELNEQLQLGAALKTIQIIGQILRNHIGSLPGDVKEKLVTTCTSLGLRSMFCLLKVFRDNLPEMVRLLVDTVDKGKLSSLKHKPEDLRKRREDANKSLWSTAQLGVVAIIKYVSDSIGSERLAETFDNVFCNTESSAISTIDLSIRLDHYTGFPEKQTLTLIRKFENNPFAFAVVRDLVWSRFYLYTTDYKIRQRICEKLLIGTKDQHHIIVANYGTGDSKSRNKRIR